MGKQVWRAVVAGGAAAVFTAVAAVPAGAAEGGASFSRVQVNGGKPIVIGTSKEVVYPASFRVVTTRVWRWQPLVYLYRNGVEDKLWQTMGGDVCPNRVGTCDARQRLHFDPGGHGMRNSEAGVWKVAGEVLFKDGSKDVDATGVTVQLRRDSHLIVNASPEPVAKGKTLTVTGKITRANWETRKYGVYGSRQVNLQFKPAGASAYTLVKKVRANGSGALRTTVKASKTGTWRWAYVGDTTTGASVSLGDYVVVK
ncbi:hypothetical protein [Streptomyces sp. NPDC101178]|uniref:hypothetical protein n=1 Tax=Streptomyces sp. NPDC101178 TaxID=3366124 RepID=UPI00382FC09D